MKIFWKKLQKCLKMQKLYVSLCINILQIKFIKTAAAQPALKWNSCIPGVNQVIGA